MQFAVDNSFTDGSKAYFEIGDSDPTASGGGFISLSTAGVDRLSIIDNGNIGIGTTIPDAKLTVKGKIHSEEVKVDLSVPGPDYVFEREYKLLSLEELKGYVDKTTSGLKYLQQSK
jgi:hypothetical protein